MFRLKNKTSDVFLNKLQTKNNNLWLIAIGNRQTTVFPKRLRCNFYSGGTLSAFVFTIVYQFNYFLNFFHRKSNSLPFLDLPLYIGPKLCPIMNTVAGNLYPSVLAAILLKVLSLELFLELGHNPHFC